MQKLLQLTLRDLFWLVALVAMGCAWWMDHQRIERMESELRETHDVLDHQISYSKRLEMRLGKKARRNATTQNPDGNAETLAFLAWSKGKCGFVNMQLDSAGNCLDLSVDICYGITDDDLREICKLRTIETLSFWAKPITDDGLKLMEGLPRLKSLNIAEAVLVSDTAFERLQNANPGLEVVIDGSPR
jgi:hypothetical protein